MGSKAKTPRQIQQTPPPQTQLNNTGWGGMGPTIPQNPMQMGTPQTGVGTGAPAWAQGDFAMPWWGQQAPNVGAAMLQQQDPSGYQNMLAMQQPQQRPQTQQVNTPSYVLPEPNRTYDYQPPDGMFDVSGLNKYQLMSRMYNTGR
jgi:hypothetical protein